MADSIVIPHRPSLISWNLTRRCNLRCPHCYLEAGKKADNELTTAECLALIDEIKALGTEMVILTGGEPLLRKDIYELAQTASSRGRKDTEGVFHRIDLSDEAMRLIDELSRAHGIPVVDARDWLPADRFLDFDHAIFQLEALERPLAREIVNAVES